jgi:Na+/melibiose symporter-like transporter
MWFMLVMGTIGLMIGVFMITSALKENEPGMAGFALVISIIMLFGIFTVPFFARQERNQELIKNLAKEGYVSYEVNPKTGELKIVWANENLERAVLGEDAK